MTSTPASLATRFIRQFALYKRICGKTTKDFAEALSLTYATMDSIEMGLKLPSFETLCKLSNMAQVDPMWWFPETTPPDLETDALTRMAYYQDRMTQAMREIWESRKP